MTSPSCDPSSLLARPSGIPTLSSPPGFKDAARQPSVIATTSTPQTSHHRVGIIVGACLGAAGAILLVGLLLFRLLLRNRQPTETADVGSRSWSRLGGHGVVVIASHRSRSIDLAGADADTAWVAPTSNKTSSETKQSNKSTEVLDISVENAPRSPPPLEPLPKPEPIEPSNAVPPLSIHTDVHADLSPPSSHGCTPAGPSRSSIRPLPTLPTGPQVRRHRSAKAEEAHRESRHRRPLYRKNSADDVRASVHDNNRRPSTAHSENSTCWQHHHDGRCTDFPPPYSEG